LGNTGDSAAVPALAGALHGDPEPLVRAHSAWALGAIGGTEARDALASAERREENPDVLAEIRMARAG
jgi:epoxyqueuosine reductase